MEIQTAIVSHLSAHFEGFYAFLAHFAIVEFNAWNTAWGGNYDFDAWDTNDDYVLDYNEYNAGIDEADLYDD